MKRRREGKKREAVWGDVAARCVRRCQFEPLGGAVRLFKGVKQKTDRQLSPFKTIGTSGKIELSFFVFFQEEKTLLCLNHNFGSCAPQCTITQICYGITYELL